MKLHQQGNEIIATEIRPMSELKPGQYAICYRADYSSDMLKRSIERNDSLTDSMGDFYWPENIFIGYIPMPQYRPDAKHIDKTELYEKLRKLNPRQFGELFETHLKGDVSFDELVAKLP